MVTGMFERSQPAACDEQPQMSQALTVFLPTFLFLVALDAAALLFVMANCCVASTSDLQDSAALAGEGGSWRTCVSRYIQVASLPALVTLQLLASCHPQP